MFSPQVRHVVESLLAALRTRPAEYPIAELAAVQQSGVDIGIERSGNGTVVYAAKRTDSRLELLSRREREVATLAAAGFSNREIASTLYVTVATVKDHMHSIFTKTGFSSRSQLIAAWYGGLAQPT